ncbi:MAG TPA: hypothetical protein VE621_21685 [Bryobacteraceae bacterium]|jgi:hypothetical protein|nr:hypothetical protein [Bryobacteraceae bacterium]
MDELMIRPAANTGTPPGLYHIIVEISPDGTDQFVLTPMTDRALAVEMIPADRKYPSLEDVARAGRQLPTNIEISAARKDMFRQSAASIRSLTPNEIAELRRLLGP